MFKKYLFIILFIFLYPNLLSASEVSKLFKEGSYDTAFRVGYADALSGDPESSFIIGKILIDGKGSAKENINKGIEFIDSAAKLKYLKAVIFLAKNYDDGDYTAESKSKALAYYEQCEKLRGPSKCSQRVTALRIASSGEISKKSCIRYNKKNKKHFYKIAQCIAREYLDGNASSYYLMAFDNGNSGAFLLASQRMLKVKNIDLMPLVTRIPNFKNKANKSQQKKFIKQIKRFGYDGSFCGTSKIKSSKKNIFAKPKKNISSNSAACALAAEAGDVNALPVAYEWWKNGLEGFPRAKNYADGLMKNFEENEEVDIASLLRKFETDPKKHFNKAMEFISSNPLNVSVVGKELKLEIELIADGKFTEFASGYRDIANVIEYIDWKSVDSQTLSKFFVVYNLDLLEKHNHEDELTTPRVKESIKNIPYNKSFISSLGKLKGGGELANQFLISRIYDNCEALNYAIKNRDTLDIPYENIQDARKQSLNKCDFKVAKKSMKQLLKIAKRDLDSVKVFIEQRLNQRLPCSDYSDFLVYNRNDTDDFNVDYENLNEFCSQFPVVASELATKLYINKFYDEAYEYAIKGCESEDHPTKSQGCDLLAMMIIEGKTTEAENMNFDNRMSEALVYLNIGHEKGDIKSTAYLHDILDGNRIFSKYADPEIAKELLPLLKESKIMPAKLQVRKKCFSGNPVDRLFKSCAKHCRWAKRMSRKKDIDVVSLHLLKPIFKDQACKAALKN